MTKILELIIKLLEKREANRKLVLDECVKPLREQFDKIHNEYSDIFHNYRRELDLKGITDTFLKALNRDLYKIVTIRMDIVAEINSLLHVASANIDGYDLVVKDLIQSILRYLNMHDAFTHWEQRRAVSVRNPTFDRILIMVGNEPSDVASLVAFLDSVLKNLQKRYRDVTDEFSKVKSFLLTGKN